jgi:membrane-anchored glycerophosphoryl diester phosphodiesterase (GDPDase)
MIFAIPALVESEVKEAFGESWKFTQKRFWKTTAYLILTGLIIIIFGSLINFAGTLIAGTFIELIVLAIGEIFTSLYFIVAITNYFYSKQ